MAPKKAVAEGATTRSQNVNDEVNDTEDLAHAMDNEIDQSNDLTSDVDAVEKALGQTSTNSKGSKRSKESKDQQAKIEKLQEELANLKKQVRNPGKRKPRQSIGNPEEEAKNKKINDQTKKLMTKLFEFIPNDLSRYRVKCKTLVHNNRTYSKGHPIAASEANEYATQRVKKGNKGANDVVEKANPNPSTTQLKKVRKARTSKDDILPQTIIKNSKEENSEENNHEKQFVPDYRTVNQLSIEELREIVSSPAFKRVAVQLGSDEEVDYDSDSDLEKDPEPVVKSTDQKQAGTLLQKYVQPVLVRKKTDVEHSDNEIFDSVV